MPTWRQDLRDALRQSRSAAGRRAVFTASAFGSAWLGLLRSPELAAFAADTGVELRLLLHPHLDHEVPDLALPSHVRRLAWDTVGFQTELARSSLLLTDYSSTAFDAAYIDLPTVYFQFDRERMFGGAHPLRQGYFDYDRDALGPICVTPDEVVAALRQARADGFAIAEPFRTRVQAAFPERDAGNCARIVAAIERRLADRLPSRQTTGRPRR
jgi:hypothetical protein